MTAANEIINSLLKAPTFMVVEDNLNDLELFLGCLKFFDVEIVVSTTGFNAIEFARNRIFDAIFLDLKLSDMSGLEVVKSVGTIQPKAPIIIITGYPNSVEAAEVMKIGVMHVIEKPATPEVLRGLFDEFKLRVRPAGTTDASN